MGSRSIAFQLFGRGNLFQRVISGKKSRNFYRAKDIFLNTVFAVSLEMLRFLHYSMEHRSVEQRVVIFFAKSFFSATFGQKKRKLLNFFETDLTLAIALCVLNFDAYFLPAHLYDPFGCNGNVIDRGQNFQPPKIFRRQVFGNLKTQTLLKGKYYFVALLWPSIPCMASQF